MYKNKEKGFTLVELIVVIVVLGILAAIGIPRYNNYVNESRLAHIKADMKTISGLIEVVAMDDDGIFRGGSIDDLSELEKAITEGRAYKEGNPLLTETDIGGDIHTIKDLFIRSSARSKLKGSFLVDNNDEVYYITDKKIKGNTSGESGSTDKEDPEGEIDYGDAHVATDEDFAWIDMTDMINEDGMTNEEALEIGFYTFENESGFGYYQYVGEAKEIVIPHAINGNPITSYFGMFMNTDTEKVISTNPNVTSMNDMFRGSSAISLDLSSLDTSNITNMTGMFADSSATTLDLSSFKTSKVISMTGMFWDIKALSLDLSSFDTSNVTGMGGMFHGNPITDLDLSSFNTSKVIDMRGMFRNSSALDLDLSSFDTSPETDMSMMFYDSKTTTGYAKTSADADRFNASSGKPLDLTFIVE